MPPRGWKTVTLREETLRLLKALQQTEKLPTLDDTVRLLLDRARLCAEIEPRLRKLELLLLRLLDEPTSRTSGEGPESPAAGGEDEDNPPSEPCEERLTRRPGEARGGAGNPERV